MNRRAILNLTALATLGVGATAQATIWNISDPMSGLQEVPPNASPATGLCTGTFDDVTGQLNFQVNASGFVAVITAAHIHTAPAGTAGPVTFPLTGITGGTTYSSNDVFFLTPAQGATLISGGMYANVHSQAFPGGEIRGQLHPSAVPEPSALLALTAGLGLLVARRRK